VEKSKIHLKLEEYINSLNLNYQLLNNEDYIFSKTNEILDIFFKNTYLSKDKEFLKKNRDLINSILENKYEEHLKKYKKYLPRENNLDESIVYVLSLLIDNLNNEVVLKKIYDTMETYPTELIVNDLTKRTLSNIRCFYMADCRVENRIKTYYKVDLDTWFNNNYRKYYIHNKTLLKTITPLLVAYLKSNKGLSTDDYFEIIEKIIEEFLKPIEHSQSNYNLEYEIFEAISKDKDITIIIEGFGEYLVNETISPIRIKINSDNSRTLEYYRKMKNNINTSKVESITLSNIYAINDKGVSARDFYLLKLPKEEQEKITKVYSHNLYKIYDVIKGEEIQKLALESVENEEKIILECNSVLLEYFLYKPLKKQSIFKTENELKYFKEVYNITPKDNKFYVVATDTITNASSSVLKCLGEVKVITPTSLNDFILNKIQKHNSLS
jgi:hypothetical protein